MPGPTMRERTVAFYEIVEVKDGELARMDHQDWPAMLAACAGAEIQKLTWDGDDRPVIGQVYPMDDEDRLILHKQRQPGDWLSQVDFTSGEIVEVEEVAGKQFLDSTAIQFAAYGNVVGVMKGAQQSPGHTTLEGWLQNLNPFAKQIAVRPLVTPGEAARLKEASQVSRFDITLLPHQRAALAKRDGNLAQFLSRKIDIDDVRVTVSLSIPRGKKYSDSRAKLADELFDLAEVIPTLSEAAQATLYFGPDDALSKSRITELVEHSLTAKRRVPAVNEDGTSIRIRGAFVVMDSLFIELEDQLRLAADA